jgi:hypothetical protein
MSDRFENELRDHLRSEAEQTREFPRRLRGRIREGIAPRRRVALVPQLALAGALVVVAVAVLVVRNPQVIVKDITSTITKIVQPSPSPTPQPFVCQDRSGGTTGLSAQLTAVRVAHHPETPGFDRIVFDFSGGIPSYDLTRQEAATFVKDPSGQAITLDGTAGVKLVFRDADPVGVSADQKPALPQVREITQLGNFERVLSYGVGLTSSTCVRVLELTNPARLAVDVITTPASSPSAAPTPLPTVSEATNLGPFACQDASGGTSGGMPMQLTAIRVAHQPAGYDRIVFEFAAPAATTPYLPAYTVSRQSSAKFVKDPSGAAVTLQGSDGLRIVFHGASGATSYSGSRDLRPGLAVVQELEQLGDFEAVLSWGAGLSRPSCIRTVALSNPIRLVIDVQTP